MQMQFTPEQAAEVLRLQAEWRRRDEVRLRLEREIEQQSYAYVDEHFRADIEAMVAGLVAMVDADEASKRLTAGMSARPTRTEVIVGFLDTLYAGAGEGWLNVWSLRGRTSHWFPITDLHAIADTLIKLNQYGDVWFQTGLMREPLGSYKRGEEKDVIAIPSLHADIDILDPNAHKKTKLPTTLDEAMSLLDALPIRPSLIVHSGHGIQPHWIFREPLRIADEGDLARVKGMQAALQDQISTAAKARGWDQDATFDLVRLLRVPGTLNKKYQPYAPVKLLTIN